MLERQQFYFKTLENAQLMENTAHEARIGVPVECRNMYLLAFMGLLRDGYNYSKKNRMEDDFVPESPLIPNEDKGKKKKSLFGSKKEEINPNELTSMVKNKNDTYYTIRNGNKVYECSESDLKMMFGDSFLELMGLTDHTEEESTQGFKIVRPNFEEDNLDEIPEEEVFKKEDAKKIVNTVNIPIIQSDNEYPDDEPFRKKDVSFLFDKYELEISIPQGNGVPLIKQCMVFVYPLDMMNKSDIVCDIMVYTANSDNQIRALASATETERSKRISLDFSQYKLYVSGRWVNGDFESNVFLEKNPRDKYAAKETSRKLTKIRPKDRTSSYYQRMHMETGECLDIFPLTLGINEEETGYAPMVAILEDGKSRSVLTRTGNGGLTITVGGKDKTVTSYWEGDTLICDIQDFINQLDYNQ